ncbi:MAG: hypothetical protein L7S44_07815 [Flavobacteriaceae bacterium]|nr:hypothetical protein [Flavobacteriaceae bacterium]
MNVSKKEISIYIEIIFSVLFILIFMPYFYEIRLETIDFNSISKNIIQIISFSVIYFSSTYIILEVKHKGKIITDERDDMINSKAYKLGYILLDLGIIIVLGHLLSNHSLYKNNGFIIFLILTLLLSVSLIKSLFQLYLYRTS